MIPQALNIFVGSTIRRFRHLGDVDKQGTLCRTQAGFYTQVRSLSPAPYLVFCSLFTQEVGMRVQSIRTAVES